MKHEQIQAFVPAYAVAWRAPRLVIVGGGFSGAAAAIALSAQAAHPLTILIVEPSSPIGAGLAYGRAGAGHILDAPAGDLSAHADRPGDFAAWAAAEAGEDPAAASHRFLPRRSFAVYMRRRLHDAILAAPHVKITTTRDA